MPKPVLSDSLFNADDVATAVLSEANLQVANSSLGVTDISSHFTVQSGFTAQTEHFLFFNGFVFWSGYYIHTGGAPSNPETLITIDNSVYRPQSEWRLPSVGYQADTVSRVVINTNGDIVIWDPIDAGISTFYLVINGYWNVNF